MDNKSNYYYPQDVIDGKFNQCSCENVKNTNKNLSNQQPNSNFSDLNIYPNNYIQQNVQEQNYNNPQQQQQPNQNNYYAQNNDWQQHQNPQIYPQNQNQQKQKNMFGSLNPEQLMSLLSSKGNLSGLLGNLGQSNPQLGMLVGLMQNMPKTKKQSKSEDVQNTSSESQGEKKEFVKVKDYYKENQD